MSLIRMNSVAHSSDPAGRMSNIEYGSISSGREHDNSESSRRTKRLHYGRKFSKNISGGYWTNIYILVPFVFIASAIFGTLFYSIHHGWDVSMSFFYSTQVLLGNNIGIPEETDSVSQAFTLCFFLFGVSILAGAVGAFASVLVTRASHIKSQARRDARLSSTYQDGNVNPGNPEHSTNNPTSGMSSRSNADMTAMFCTDIAVAYVKAYLNLLVPRSRRKALLKAIGWDNHKSKYLTVMAAVSWCVVGLCYGLYFEKWPLSTSLYFAVGTMSAAGMPPPLLTECTNVPAELPDGTFGSTKLCQMGFMRSMLWTLYIVVGVPLFALTLGQISGLVVEKAVREQELEVMARPLGEKEFAFACTLHHTRRGVWTPSSRSKSQPQSQLQPGAGAGARVDQRKRPTAAGPARGQPRIGSWKDLHPLMQSPSDGSIDEDEILQYPGTLYPTAADRQYPGTLYPAASQSRPTSVRMGVDVDESKDCHSEGIHRTETASQSMEDYVPSDRYRLSPQRSMDTVHALGSFQYASGSGSRSQGGDVYDCESINSPSGSYRGRTCTAEAVSENDVNAGRSSSIEAEAEPVMEAEIDEEADNFCFDFGDFVVLELLRLKRVYFSDLQAIKDLFDDIDDDGSGFINKEKLLRYHTALQHENQQEEEGEELQEQEGEEGEPLALDTETYQQYQRSYESTDTHTSSVSNNDASEMLLDSGGVRTHTPSPRATASVSVSDIETSSILAPRTTATEHEYPIASMDSKEMHENMSQYVSIALQVPPPPAGGQEDEDYLRGHLAIISSGCDYNSASASRSGSHDFIGDWTERSSRSRSQSASQNNSPRIPSTSSDEYKSANRPSPVGFPLPSLTPTTGRSGSVYIGTDSSQVEETVTMSSAIGGNSRADKKNLTKHMAVGPTMLHNPDPRNPGSNEQSPSGLVSQPRNAKLAAISESTFEDSRKFDDRQRSASSALTSTVPPLTLTPTHPPSRQLMHSASNGSETDAPTGDQNPSYRPRRPAPPSHTASMHQSYNALMMPVLMHRMQKAVQDSVQDSVQDPSSPTATAGANGVDDIESGAARRWRAVRTAVTSSVRSRQRTSSSASIDYKPNTRLDVGTGQMSDIDDTESDLLIRGRRRSDYGSTRMSLSSTQASSNSSSNSSTVAWSRSASASASTSVHESPNSSRNRVRFFSSPIERPGTQLQSQSQSPQTYSQVGEHAQQSANTVVPKSAQSTAEANADAAAAAPRLSSPFGTSIGAAHWPSQHLPSVQEQDAEEDKEDQTRASRDTWNSCK